MKRLPTVTVHVPVIATRHYVLKQRYARTVMAIAYHNRDTGVCIPVKSPVSEAGDLRYLG